MAEGKLKIELYRSLIGTPEKLRRVVRGLGLRRINQVVERPDTAAIRGMVAKVRHLVRIREQA
jgi:large subunit ribosomal protein L30